jgi:undecaprenyl pyrophosphate synthase
MFGFGRKKTEALNPAKLPRHIAFIMDGNGRWAKRRGISRSFGHSEGSRQLKEIVKICYNLHIPCVSVYAFSTENWARPNEEVAQLMKLLLEYLRGALDDLEDRKVRIRIIGSRDGLRKTSSTRWIMWSGHRALHRHGFSDLHQLRRPAGDRPGGPPHGGGGGGRRAASGRHR